MINIAAISGSLRKDSYNSSLLRAAFELKPEDMKIEILDISKVPVFNDDVRTTKVPESVEAIADKIVKADGLLIVTPEYNYSIPGILKNVIDWISKMPSAPFNGKPTAIMGASTGMLGTVRAQVHLRQVGLALNLNILNQPEVYVGLANEKFDSSGKLTDEKTRKKVNSLLVALGNRIRS